MNDVEDVLEYLTEMSNKVFSIREELNIVSEIIDDIQGFLRDIEED